ncbi:MAG: short-chain dehydrogenase [Zetaproteobacteria bacterium CG12_big_fil_rev_8_21_14_0_65_55_1124]|nr:MAG: short-chain dehydrogenase [Zetaproteobacteria bacterium CG1_02_55_237]PIS19823.1 MAG: short-chain dehydrogenase [Zetaproteobacteria bacterium CG08_land_8_20_14_0_20_55_17]PIW42852.1 MAG: short-chain dehydrogenase [Zetaproteobacteria bacterium CG12_big_fil_rev_8_21_14_0_65_55_1124]PIY51670.1 MAG: short-chain dehydrogenase [Zetaproteobacteria bacterium CG_4_10_14_0_8_um_filter_55_43]PIZ39843.1 MAG: short-chain dehydrogenase [Zetaproteobacteria bacterium CG_4_10_14_0_2_um_filter_55_20]PJB
MNVLITGGNRGLGLGFVQHYLGTGHDVWAGHRADIGGLADIKHSGLHLLQWDVGEDDEPLGELPEHIDLLINCAGIYGPGKDGQELDKVRPAVMQDVFNVDCIGPLRVVQRLHKRMVRGGVIANLSSKMGSSGDNSSGGTYAYRAAKAALVIVSKSMAVDLAPASVHVITLHPGWVRTDMTHQTGLIDVEDSVSGMADVIERARDYAPGAFIAFDGQEIPY